MMGRTREYQGGMRYGGYLALEIDHFEGDSVSGDFGGKIRPDDMEMSTIPLPVGDRLRRGPLRHRRGALLDRGRDVFGAAG